jgi:ketosteroid isomerase-like protein
MSQENVQLVKAMYELWNQGDIEAATELFDPDVVWHGYAHLPDSGRRDGVDQVRAWVTDFAEAWGEIRVSIERLVGVGDDTVLALVRMSGRGRGSGVAVTSGVDGHVWTIRDGRIVAVRLYQGRHAALEAVGLSE